MTLTLKRVLGLDTHADHYAYASDPVMGHTAERKIPDRWVETTCGYCSVGCGMFIGVKDGRAVSVRGNPDHPVNNGTLCPKGLSEHETLHVSTRARYPLLRKSARGGAVGVSKRERGVDPRHKDEKTALERVRWEEAIDTLVRRFRDVREAYGPEAVGVVSTGQQIGRAHV